MNKADAVNRSIEVRDKVAERKPAWTRD